MQYSKICETYKELEENPSRLKKTEILAGFLNNLKKEKNKEIIYLLQGRVFPDYEEKELGISTQITIKALSKATGIVEENIVKKWKKIGDLGEVTEEITRTKKQSTLFSKELSIDKVLENIRKLPELTGKGTVDRKLDLISELLTSASPIEAKYIARTILNDLRIGVGEGTLRDAIIGSCFPDKDKKEASEKIQSAYDKSNDFAEVFEKACIGYKELEKIELNPGKPLRVMLALKAENIADGFERVGKPACFEYKYDGFRMLINKDKKGEIKVFTRRLDEVTKQFPEVKEYVKNAVKADTFIIDTEAVGYNPKTKKYTSFQDISQRIKRKHGIEQMQKELPIEINAFDILYYNGKSFIDEPFSKRTELLRKIIKTEKWKFRTSEQLITSDEKEAEKFYAKSLKEGEEGVMIKNLFSPYHPGARVGHMLKLKPASNELDLVITGAEYGTGKRGGWMSSFDVSCRDEETGHFLEIGKVGTGIKEKTKEESGNENGVSFDELTELLKPLIVSEDGKTVKVKPKIIITVVFQEIQQSPSYSSGFALRFPRLTALRLDRKPGDIATLEEVKTAYKRELLKREF
jgi:DNA ligase-1